MDEVLSELPNEALELYENLSPLRKRVAMQMMIAAAHMVGRINIEEAEEASKENDYKIADTVSHIITRSII